MHVSLRRRNSRPRTFQQWWSVALVIIAIAVQPLGVYAQISPLDGEPPIVESSVSAIDSNDPAVQAQINQYMIQYVDALSAATLEKMTVEDRVGQLFIVNFQGDETGQESDIASLIHEYRIGGVMLSPAYGNFSNQKNLDTPVQVASLTNRLQALAYGRVMPEQMALGVGDDGNIPVDQLPLLVGGRAPLNNPLFIGVEQLGDDLGLTSLRNGFTQLPNQLALGSTWDIELARGVGEIVGRELAAVGVNLLIGPVLDITAQPRTDGVGSLGVHTFGGDPFWGGEMGSAYISGVHLASENYIATVARHFPGQGDVDRMPDEEVATIQSSVDTMRRVALPPFTAVTQVPGDDGEQIRPPSVTDGMMSSHMRYSAFQAVSNEHITPLGFSRDLSGVLENEGFGEWRAHGGLLMSNALGLPAIRRDYDATLSEFPFRRAALDAFIAGNDLIYLGNLSQDGDWDAELANITEVVRFFQERYISDLDFAVQVDAAARRILRTKLLLHLDRDALTEQAIAALSAADAGATPSPIAIEPNIVNSDAGDVDPNNANVLAVDAPAIPLERLFVTRNGLAILGDESESRLEANALVRTVAGESISILYPDPQMVAGALPATPQSGEQLLIFTDSRLYQECDACLAEALVPPEEIAEIIIRLYGPDATDQVVEEQLTSLTFSDLAEVLDAEEKAEDEAVPSVGTEISTTEPISVSAALVLRLPGTDKVSKIERQIDEADWIIFAMLNVDPERRPNSDVVKRFLGARSGQLEGKNVIVLALQSPYFLDATEIGQLTSYLGVYSRSTPFLENTVRTLFRNFVPHGAPAVSVDGTRFSDLGVRLAPDPDALMPLSISSNDVDVIADVEVPTVDAGDTIRIQVGPISDHNGHPVPDGVKVDFQLKYEGTELVLPIEAAYTQGGVATRSVLLDSSGVLRVSADSGEATTGAPIAIMVAETSAGANAGDVAQSVQPAPDQGVAEVVDGALVTDSAVIADASLEASPLLAPTERVNLVTLVVALFTILLVLSLLLIVQVGTMPRATLVYNMLWAVIVGLIAYVLYGLGLIPGGEWLRDQLSVGAAAVVVVLGMILPLLWLQLRMESTQ